jgi:CRISPR/Cas system-associated exonuclease Cas4 (RecB family)
MIITYLRSSSYGTHSMCPMQYFIEYNLGIKSPSNKKADKGTICHKVLEILAHIKLCMQNNTAIYTDDILGDINISKYKLNTIIEQVYSYYTKQFKHHTWEVVDYKDCHRWVYKAMESHNGTFNPLNRTIVQPEQHFDICIEKPWAKYKYDTKDGVIEGNLAIKGTIDLITSVDDSTIEIIDWKTGRRLDWATGEEKTLAKLQDDAQLRIYHYAVSKLYPSIDHIIFTINFINDGGAFSVCFEKNDLLKTEDMIRKKFETIKNTKIPQLNKSWKCNKLCFFGKTTFENTHVSPIKEYRENELCKIDQTMTKCEQVKHDIFIKGIDKVIEQYTMPGYSVGKYKAPGSTE